MKCIAEYYVRIKPEDCTCDYPEITARNMTCHAPDCPSHARILEWMKLPKTATTPTHPNFRRIDP